MSSAPINTLRLATDQFFLLMAVVIAAVVIYGFGFTIGDNLIHPAYPRPLVLYIHAAVMSAWIALFIVQAGMPRGSPLRSPWQPDGGCGANTTAD